VPSGDFIVPITLLSYSGDSLPVEATGVLPGPFSTHSGWMR